MKQEDKELLFKDLSARLPYAVKVNEDIQGNFTLIGLTNERVFTTCEVEGCHNDFPIESVKPYLFPLSSMTKEQYEKWCDLEAEPLDIILTKNANGEKMSTLEHHLLIAKSLTDSINYCYKNHFDIYGLIPKNLAIDATGLNIYKTIKS